MTDVRPETEKLKKLFRKEFNSELKNYLNVQSWDVIVQLLESESAIALLPDFCLNKANSKYFKSHHTDWFQAKYEVFFHKQKNSKQMMIQFIYQSIIDEMSRKLK